MSSIREHTDLAPLHPRLFPCLRSYDVIHTTDAFFALSKTALFFAKRSGKPIVLSIHTDIPKYTRIYTEVITRRLFGDGHLSRVLLERFHFASHCAAGILWKRDRYLRRCDWVLVSNEADPHRVLRAIPDIKVSFLRRGIDKEMFHPKWTNRAKLREAFGIAKDRFLLLFVGKVDPVKNVMILARAAKVLLDRGEPIHVMIVGDGTQREAVGSLLGSAASFPGVVPHSTMNWLYASADLFVFPSETEIYPNVVIEAKASGLPVLVAQRGGAAQCVAKDGVDGFIIGENDPDLWARAIEFLRRSRMRCVRMGEEARKHIESDWPSWEEVLARDLMPVWEAVARKCGDPRGGKHARLTTDSTQSPYG